MTQTLTQSNHPATPSRQTQHPPGRGPPRPSLDNSNKRKHHRHPASATAIPPDNSNKRASASASTSRNQTRQQPLHPGEWSRGAGVVTGSGNLGSVRIAAGRAAVACPAGERIFGQQQARTPNQPVPGPSPSPDPARPRTPSPPGRRPAPNPSPPPTLSPVADFAHGVRGVQPRTPWAIRPPSHAFAHNRGTDAHIVIKEQVTGCSVAAPSRPGRWRWASRWLLRG
jgi:hypothetical protein